MAGLNPFIVVEKLGRYLWKANLRDRNHERRDTNVNFIYRDCCATRPILIVLRDDLHFLALVLSQHCPNRAADITELSGLNLSICPLNAPQVAVTIISIEMASMVHWRILFCLFLIERSLRRVFVTHCIFRRSTADWRIPSHGQNVIVASERSFLVERSRFVSLLDHILLLLLSLCILSEHTFLGR